MKVRNASDIKWYLYVSTAKLETLYRQVIASQSERRTLDWSISIGVAKVSRKVETADEPDEEDKLRAVIDGLDAAGLIGTIEEPREYIRGILPMRWGLLADFGRPDEEPPLVLFAANHDDLVIGLGGSSRHVKYNYGASSTGSRSITPFLVGHLLNGLGLPLDGWHAARPWADESNYQTFMAVKLAEEHLLRRQSTEQNLEFVAKVLVQSAFADRVRDHNVTSFLLGTPLYVSLAAPVPHEMMNY